MESLLAPIHSFLACETPKQWIEMATKAENLTPLLLDHCNCELKAAQTALMMIRKYAVDKESGTTLMEWVKPYEAFIYSQERNIKAFLARDVKKNDLVGDLTPKANFAHGSKLSVELSADIVTKMVRLIKEEFHHFEQVLQIMQRRGIAYQNIRASRYAKGLMTHMRTHEPLTLIDKLIVGAFIEARSCERFAKIAPHLDDELNKFYVSLLRSEARHYQDYLALAQAIADFDIQDRIAFFAEKEAELILSADTTFRFHSGVPQ